MSLSEVDLLEIVRGTVVAAAGCGKTHSITTALANYRGERPVLVLTHTNAGVAALENRLRNTEVRRSAYRLYTLDAFAFRLVRMFPMRSGVSQDSVDPRSASFDYQSVRGGALRLLTGGHLEKVLRATYERVIVDEYQDCCTEQHAMVCCLAQSLPVCVLGDPLQAIFGIGGTVLPRWEDVLAKFPLAATLTTPHRWERANAAELGHWLAGVRSSLLAGRPVSLSGAPDSVEWVRVASANDTEGQLRAAATRVAKSNNSVLVIADSAHPQRHSMIAKRCFGSVVENAELSDLHDFAARWDEDPPSRGGRTFDLLGTVFVGFRAGQLRARLAVLGRGKSKKLATGLEQAALLFTQAPGPVELHSLLRALRKAPGVRMCRPTAVHALERSVASCCESEARSLLTAFVTVRDGLRRSSRAQGGRLVGSTLLVKGLEAELAVVLNPAIMSARDLYVALTRGARRLTVCSATDILTPA